MVAPTSLPRFASNLLDRALTVSPVVVVMGARQTGKSTLVQFEPFSRRRLYHATRIRDITGLQLFRQEYGDRFVGGLLLHAGSQVEWLADGMLAAPWWRVL